MIRLKPSPLAYAIGDGQPRPFHRHRHPSGRARDCPFWIREPGPDGIPIAPPFHLQRVRGSHIRNRLVPTFEFVIGSTAVSLAVLLGTFMGGMCLGSLALPRLVSPRWHPLCVCAFLESGIGILGIAVLIGMPHVVRLFDNAAGHGPVGILLRGGISALCLLPPTVLMGATLPAISRWLETTPKGISWLGFFYGCNTVGAVFGCLLAGFYLLRVYDMPTATFVAAVINLFAALLGFTLAARAPAGPETREKPRSLPLRPRASQQSIWPSPCRA